MELLWIASGVVGVVGLRMFAEGGSGPSAGDASAGRNRLAQTHSPYLLQHSGNPVDWYPWGREALEKAEREDKPVFLSVGYSTCHWCHVMAHESFEDEDLAATLNEHFVPIKVDREERPEVDSHYMIATQLIARHAGWPNSVFLTPDGRPWFAGTYFPKDDRGGRPGFKTVLRELGKAWKNRRSEIEQQADQVADAIRRFTSGEMTETPDRLTRGAVDQAVAQIRSSFDANTGGFGGAPKFPPHGQLLLLADRYRRDGDVEALNMVTQTLDAMAMGGVRDHVGGGFHRYSTDPQWFLPHFEKMLYDNAQFARAYTDGFLLTGHTPYRGVVEEIFEWLQREMTSPEGGFYSARDAESEGEEGKYYVWGHDEILEILGEADGRLFNKAYGVKPEGNFREEATGEPQSRNILHLPRPIGKVAEEEGVDPQSLRERLDAMRKKLLEARNRRVPPSVDDKILTSWNGLMIAGLAYAGRHTGDSRYVDAARRAADFLRERLRTDDGGLLHMYRAGHARLPAYLDDYAFLADGLLELHAASGERRYLDEAKELVDRLRRDHEDRDAGGFFFTAAGQEPRIDRTKDPAAGGNLPSGNGVAARALTRLADLTGEEEYRTAAVRTIGALSGIMSQAPQANPTLLIALADHLDRTGEEALELATRPSVASDADAVAGESPVVVEAFASQRRVRPGATAEVAVRLSIDEGAHVYGPAASDSGVAPLSVAVTPHGPGRADEASYPEPEWTTDPVLNQSMAIYRDQATVTVPVRIDAEASGSVAVHVEVRSQACDATRCLPPRTERLSLSLDVGEREDEPRHPEIFGNG